MLLRQIDTLIVDNYFFLLTLENRSFLTSYPQVFNLVIHNFQYLFYQILKFMLPNVNKVTFYDIKTQ